MKREMLFAVDGSSKCLQALTDLGRLVKDNQNFNFTLFHCLPRSTQLHPGEIWEADTTVGLAKKSQDDQADNIFSEAANALSKIGISGDRIHQQVKHDSVDPGYEILNEAKDKGFHTIALSRRGRTQTQSLVLGSVSSRVAQYAEHRTVWVIDSPVHKTGRVLIAVEGVPECRMLTYYVSQWLASIPNLKFTMMHLLPPVPPSLWDDGHILDSEEQVNRRKEKDNWRTEWIRKVEHFMDEARHALVHNGVSEDRIETRVNTVREGVARDLLNEINRNRYELVLIGKRSFHKKKPFLMGSHANKILYNANSTMLCLVDSS